MAIVMPGRPVPPVTQPYPDLLTGMAEAVAKSASAVLAGDTIASGFWRGVVDGMNAAMFGQARDVRVEAAQTPYATCGSLSLVKATLTWLPIPAAEVEQAAWASGVLWGFRQATDDQDDAEVCSACDQRVLTQRDELACSCDDHGWFWSPDCQRSLCNPVSSTCGRCAA